MSTPDAEVRKRMRVRACSYCHAPAVESIFWKAKRPRHGASGHRTVTVGIHACAEHRTCINFTTSPGYAERATGAES